MESLPPESKATNFIAEIFSVVDNGMAAVGILMMNYHRYRLPISGVEIFFFYEMARESSS